MSNALQTTVAEREVSFIPFGANESDAGNQIRLSVSIIKQFLVNKTRSGAICDDVQALKFVMLCKARRLNPWEGDAYCIGFDTQDGPQFSLVTAHQAFLKRAECHPNFEGMESGVVVKEGNTFLELPGDFYTGEQQLVGAWARVHRKGWLPTFRKIRIEDYRKPFGVWKTNPGTMIVKCAEADALRSAFPTIIGGMYLREEIEAQVITDALPAARSNLLPKPSVLPHPTAATTAAGAPAPATTQAAPASDSPKPVEEPSAATAPRRGRPPKVAPVVAAAAPPPEPPPADPPEPEPDPFAEGTGVPPEKPAEPAGPKIEPLPFNEDADPIDSVTTIRNALRAINKTESNLMEWARSRDMASAKQSYISHLSLAKLKGICESWPAIAEELQAPV